MPEELAQQMPVMKEVLTAMRIPIYACQGWEADDVIGTVSKICCGRDWQCVVVTGDRDSLQLVNDCVSVKLVATKGGQTLTTLYTPAVFEAEYGFEPRRLIDLKSLMGDSSDNIPGVAGVGPKTATDLLLKFGTLDGIYEHLDSPTSGRPCGKSSGPERRAPGSPTIWPRSAARPPSTFRPRTHCGRRPTSPPSLRSSRSWNLYGSSTATVSGPPRRPPRPRPRLRP